MKVLFSPPDITEAEIREVSEAMRSGWITTGPRTKKLECRIADFLGTGKVACLNSATAAMEMTLRILGMNPGDEVITSAYTYTASASVVEHVGAKIVLIDTDEESFEMDYEKLAYSITERTKAVIPVDLGGRMCDYGKIRDAIDSKRSLFKPSNDIQSHFGRPVIVADSAHAFGAARDGCMSGLEADFTSFSFHAVKNFTTAEGGAVTWRPDAGLDDEDMYRQFMLASLHGQNKDALAKAGVGAWEYDIIYPAYKCNMTDITAAIGLIQLDRYPGLLARRREIISKYDETFVPMGMKRLVHFDEHSESSGHLYLLRIPGADEKTRNEMIQRMGARDIACNVHYKPLPMMTAYRNLGFDIADYPNAYSMYRNEITLPLHTKLTDEEVDYVRNSMKEIINDTKLG